MMDGINMAVVLEIISKFGTLGVLIIVWWSDRSQLRRQQEAAAEVLVRYGKDMSEVRQMYENNIKLVDGYESIAGDLREVVIMNTQAVTKLCSDVEHNEYCPKVRLEKRATGEQR